MAATTAGRLRSFGGGRGLTRDAIARAALAYIDRFGSPRLTMRALGQSLGVEAMSLYRYVSSRQDLMDAVVAVLVGQLTDQMNTLQDLTWQRYLQSLAVALRRIAIDHPKAFPLLTTPSPAAPWLRPPLPSTKVAEELLTTLSDHGFTDDEAVVAYRRFSSFLLGQLLSEATVGEAEPTETVNGAAATSTRVQGAGDLGEWPTLDRMRTRLLAPCTAEEFERSLASLLEGFTPTTTRNL